MTENKPSKKGNKDCFIIMPISDTEGYDKGHFNHVYEDIIKVPSFTPHLMKTKLTLLLLLCLFYFRSSAQDVRLSKEEIQQDLDFLTEALNQNSSYVYLNGYDFNEDFENYLDTLSDSTSLEDFGLFLTDAMGKIGDRHFSIRGYDNDSLFLPFVYAPENGKVLVLDLDADGRLQVRCPDYPYLSRIGQIDIKDFLQKIRPEDNKAPKAAYFTKAVRDIRDVQKNYKLLNKTLPKKIRLTLSDPTFQKDTVLFVAAVPRSERSRPWDEKFETQYSKAYIRDEDYNKRKIINGLFKTEDDIAYIKIPSMVSKDEAPRLFRRVRSFMGSIQDNSKALIIDIRSNGGGTRDLMYEFAKYLIHPDSIYVVNVTQQKAPLPLSADYVARLHGRYLHAFSELDHREQRAVSRFLEHFTPMYDLDDTQYSAYYFGLFNGEKLSEGSPYYGKPVYILANEKSFSAASVFAAAFKGIPDVYIAGVTTDGSSGNSERIELPNSKLRGKVSTMVSFQKDGRILDGYGTAPDVVIERDRNQILWQSDSQLEQLKSVIGHRH